MFAGSLFRGRRKAPALSSAAVLCRWRCVAHLCLLLPSLSLCLSVRPALLEVWGAVLCAGPWGRRSVLTSCSVASVLLLLVVILLY